MDIFYNKQPQAQKDLYIELLQIIGSLSNLFSESSVPYIYYRAMENVFCKAFEADNLSRSDISADAGKNGIGIGLKTFLQGNGKTFQKVAEFNKDSVKLNELSKEEIVLAVSKMRNKRIITTKRICNLDQMIYHLLTRSKNKLALYEEPMDLIDINNIKLLDRNVKTTIHFTDGIHHYSFNKSKSTLSKKFNTEDKYKILDFPVKILNDPFEFLLNLKHNNNNINYKNNLSDIENIINNKNEIIDYVILPLYSPRSNKVEEKSGLNQWNAGGRKRNPNEVYISFPSWIHKVKPEFFNTLYNTSDNKTRSFNVILPNKKSLAMKIAQSNGKALMSNPNKALGEWLLREVLNLPLNTLVTKELLDIIGIDSVMLSKFKDNTFALDFLKSGSYKKFAESYKNKI